MRSKKNTINRGEKSEIMYRVVAGSNVVTFLCPGKSYVDMKYSTADRIVEGMEYDIIAEYGISCTLRTVSKRLISELERFNLTGQNMNIMKRGTGYDVVYIVQPYTKGKNDPVYPRYPSGTPMTTSDMLEMGIVNNEVC